MTGLAGPERGYRRLLAVYPQAFRREQEEEMLGVLMAGASPGQRWPGLAEAADVIRSGLGMRLRRAGRSAGSPAWKDALMSAGLAAPLLVVMTAVLEVALPYHLAAQDQIRYLRELGGPSLLSQPGFDAVVGGQVIIAAAMLAGRRRLALLTVVAVAVFWPPAANYGSPQPLWVLAAAALVLEAAALTVVPRGREARWLMRSQKGPALTGIPRGREVRWLLRWQEGAALLLAAAAIAVLTLISSVNSYQAQIGVRLGPGNWKMLPGPGIGGYVAAALVLVAAAAGLALRLRISRYFLLLAALCYPAVLELAESARTRTDLTQSPDGGHYIMFFIPPLLLLAAIMIRALGLRPADRKPRPAWLAK